MSGVRSRTRAGLALRLGERKLKVTWCFLLHLSMHSAGFLISRLRLFLNLTSPSGLIVRLQSFSFPSTGDRPCSLAQAVEDVRRLLFMQPGVMPVFIFSPLAGPDALCMAAARKVPLRARAADAFNSAGNTDAAEIFG